MIHAEAATKIQIPAGVLPAEFMMDVVPTLRKIIAKNFDQKHKQHEESNMPQDNFKDYYKILQVDPSADIKIIEKTWKTILSELGVHPDKGGDTEKAKDVNEAHDVLTDPDKRSKYDAIYQEAHRPKHENAEGFKKAKLNLAMSPPRRSRTDRNRAISLESSVPNAES